MKKIIFLLCSIFLFPVLSQAQYGAGGVHLPQESQKASVSQTIGMTDMEIVYHRPAVKGRKIWGELVPYNSSLPWRGGANENTTISFSTDVTIEGKPLPAGTYGLHFLPTEKEWTIIFSKNSTSWGSFSYDEKEDAIRVKAVPQASPLTEYLTYSFVNPEPNKVYVYMYWEKLAVGFHVEVNTHDVALASIRKELRSTPGFSWKGYNSAANYCAEENINLTEALEWAKESVSDEEHFSNLETLADIQKKLGKTADADSTMAKAMIVAKPIEVHSYARQLLRDKKVDEAMKLFEYNLKKNPNEWFVYSGIARGYEAKGDMKSAKENMQIALAKAPDNAKANITGILKQWETKN
jgi:predicted Zn-dependent protease